jgi:predicted alpha/beta hydrolase family esterase
MTTILCIGLLLFLFSSPLLSYTFFWYETANSEYRVRLKELSQGKVKRWLLYGFLTASISYVVVLLLRPFVFWRKLWFPSPDLTCSYPPVLFVHGLFHNASAWVFYRLWFKKAGFTNVYAWTFNTYKYSFPELVGQFKAWVQEVARHYPEKEFILVGHSLGGLLVRAYVEGAGEKEKVKGVVTLGTPHKGSKLAALGMGKLAQSLVYRGPLIQWLGQETSPSQVPCLAIYSPVDNMVFPHESLHPPHAHWSHQLSSPISHVTMLYHKKTARQALEFLKDIC